MDLESRIDRLERLMTARVALPDWVTPRVASQELGIPARRLVHLYDAGELPRDCARQTNKSKQRRRLLFNLPVLKNSIGGPVLS